MKPSRIILVRHGQSEGNVNKSVYKDTPDYALHLTETGRKQAHDVGKQLKELIGDQSVKFYVSPFWRTRETYLEIKKWFDPAIVAPTYEDPRLIEQEWGQNMEDRSGYQDKIEEYRDNYGHFYYRFRDGGESCADVYYRMSDFLDTMWRDFRKLTFPQNVIIVTHGMAMRLFLMRWFHYTVEEFERIKNPKNCGMFIMEWNNDTEHYVLKTELLTHVVRHPFQFPNYTTLPLD